MSNYPRYINNGKYLNPNPRSSMKTYRQGQIDMFNRIWDASDVDDYLESAMLIIKELNKIKDELEPTKPSSK